VTNGELVRSSFHRIVDELIRCLLSEFGSQFLADRTPFRQPLTSKVRLLACSPPRPDLVTAGPLSCSLSPLPVSAVQGRERRSVASAEL